jgi:hypothetical protein
MFPIQWSLYCFLNSFLNIHLHICYFFICLFKNISCGFVYWIVRISYEWETYNTDLQHVHSTTCSDIEIGSMRGVAVRALASHHYDPGSIPGFGVTCELNLLLILSLASKVFPRFSSLRKNQHY